MPLDRTKHYMTLIMKDAPTQAMQDGFVYELLTGKTLGKISDIIPPEGHFQCKLCGGTFTHKNPQHSIAQELSLEGHLFRSHKEYLTAKTLSRVPKEQLEEGIMVVPTDDLIWKEAEKLASESVPSTGKKEIPAVESVPQEPEVVAPVKVALKR